MNAKFKHKLYDIVFEADTPIGKAFDIGLLSAILLSIALVMLESVDSINNRFGTILKVAEWLLTGIFTLEYIIRIYIVKHPLKYIFSFYGIIDLLSVLPSYVGIFTHGKNGLSVIRALRLLRIFRILKLSRYVDESSTIYKALLASRRKISVFLYAIVLIVTVIGTIMYLLESNESGFTSIPQSIYWAVVTLTTVGYGDIAPQSVLGKFVASLVMVMGYAIIAVPTGIVTSEMARAKSTEGKLCTEVCENCLAEGHDNDAVHCKYCGHEINEDI